VRPFGKALQASALGLLLVGLYFGMEGGPKAMSREIGYLALGVVIFLVGLKIERR